MGPGMFDGLGTAIAIICTALFFLAPLGIWKLIEILSHISIVWN